MAPPERAARQAELALGANELAQEKQLSPLPPTVVGGAVVIPVGLLQRLRGERPATADPGILAKLRDRVERLASVLFGLVIARRHGG